MAYFDSAKNRALWQVELSRLTEERERRRNGERPGRTAGGDAMGNSSSMVQRITFSELLAEHEKSAGKKSHTVSSSLTREMTKTEKTDALSPRHKKSL